MRYVTVIVDQDPSTLHPVERRVAADPAVRRDAIHVFEDLEDGSVACLAAVEGDLDRCREIFASAPDVHEFTLSDDGSGYVYCRLAPTPQYRRLREWEHDTAFVLQMPIEFTPDGGRRVTLVGREADFAEFSREVPDGYDLELVSTGPYRPDSDGVFDVLTDRQREVLDTAVRLGYYETPRRVTLAEVAGEIGIEPGTAGKHLRHVESKVFSQFVR